MVVVAVVDGSSAAGERRVAVEVLEFLLDSLESHIYYYLSSDSLIFASQNRNRISLYFEKLRVLALVPDSLLSSIGLLSDCRVPLSTVSSGFGSKSCAAGSPEIL